MYTPQPKTLTQSTKSFKKSKFEVYMSKIRDLFAFDPTNITDLADIQSQ
jgi:hypothetical protein